MRRFGYFFLQLLFFAICMGALYWGWQAAMRAQELSLTCIKVEAPFRHLKEKEIERVITPFVQTTFLALDIQALRDRLMQVSWVKGVEIARLWPDTLTLRIQEQRPLVHWQTDYFLNEVGERFHSAGKQVVPDVPYLSGPDDQVAHVLHEFQRMNTILQTLGISIKKCQLSERQAWTLELDNGMKLKLGRQAYFERLTRFVRAYHSIFISQNMRAEWVDLSYPNGIAVNWRKEPA